MAWWSVAGSDIRENDMQWKVGDIVWAVALNQVDPECYVVHKAEADHDIITARRIRQDDAKAAAGSVDLLLRLSRDGRTYTYRTSTPEWEMSDTPTGALRVARDRYAKAEAFAASMRARVEASIEDYADWNPLA